MPGISINRVLTFKQIPSPDGPGHEPVWRTRVGHRSRDLCDSGVREYVDLPWDCVKFDAIITVGRPPEAHFELVSGWNGIQIDTTGYTRYFPGLRQFLKELHDAGYRYIRVEYDQ